MFVNLIARKSTNSRARAFDKSTWATNMIYLAKPPTARDLCNRSRRSVCLCGHLCTRARLDHSHANVTNYAIVGEQHDDELRVKRARASCCLSLVVGASSFNKFVAHTCVWPLVHLQQVTSCCCCCVGGLKQHFCFCTPARAVARVVLINFARFGHKSRQRR